MHQLVTLANPGMELDLQDQLATKQFLKGLRNQKVAYEVMNRDPSSIVEAQRLVGATLQVDHSTNRGPSLCTALTVKGLPIQANVDTGAETTIISEGL